MIGRLLITCALSFSVLFAVAGGKETIGVGDFRSIDTRGNIELVIVQSDDSTSCLEVSYNGVRQKDFHYKVRKGVLYLDIPSGLLDSKGFVRVVAITPHLERIISAGASIECRTPIKGEYFEYSTDGSINLARLNIEVDRLIVNTTGQSDVMVAGSATEATLKAKFGSRIDAFSLATQIATAKAYDQSEIYVRAKELLKAKATSAATIYYTMPVKIEPRVSFFGDVVLIERIAPKPLFVDWKREETPAVQATPATSKVPVEKTDNEPIAKKPKEVKKPTAGVKTPSEPANRDQRKVNKKRNTKTGSGEVVEDQPTTDGDFF